MIVNPYGMSLIDWADQVTDTYPQMGRLMDNGWQLWGEQLIMVAQKDVPNPHQFDTWREWAELLNEVM